MKTTASHTTTNVPQGPSVEPKGMILRPLPTGPSPPPAWEAVPASHLLPAPWGRFLAYVLPSCLLFPPSHRPPRPGRGGVPPDPASWAQETPTAWPGQGAGPSPRAPGVSAPPAPHTMRSGHQSTEQGGIAFSRRAALEPSPGAAGTESQLWDAAAGPGGSWMVRCPG